MARKFHNQILSKKATPALLKRMAAGYCGEIKAVTDIARGLVAAGAEWHVEARDLLIKIGGDPDDMWGARVNVTTGEIIYKSQINDGRDEALDNEIIDDDIRYRVESLIRKFLI